MKLQTVVVAVLLIALAGIAYLNQGLLVEEKSVLLPWGTYSLPLVGGLAVGSATALVLMLLLSAISHALHRRAHRKAEERLSQRDREIALVKSRAYDEVADKIEVLRHDVTTQLSALHASIERLGSDPTPPRSSLTTQTFGPREKTTVIREQR